MGFSRQEYWNGLPGPPPGHLPNSGTEPASLALAGDSLPLRLQGSPICRHCATGREHHRFWFGGAPGTRPLRGACTAVSLSVPSACPSFLLPSSSHPLAFVHPVGSPDVSELKLRGPSLHCQTFPRPTAQSQGLNPDPTGDTEYGRRPRTHSRPSSLPLSHPRVEPRGRWVWRSRNVF